MVPLGCPNEYMFNLHATSYGEAKRLWRKHIKDQWDNKCAYCGSDRELTIDHVVPRSKGGLDTSKNVVACCKSCNGDKGHTPWEEWYSSMEFFNEERYDKIKEWIKPEAPSNLYVYRKRENPNAS